MNAPMIERRKGGFMLRHNPLLVDKLVRIKREREGEIVAVSFQQGTPGQLNKRRRIIL